jgi:DNA-binding response OmpR family regulator
MDTPLPRFGRILVVDDEQPILFALKNYFSVFGYEVDCAEEMEEAEALLANVTYALAIIDLRLTGLGGNEGLQVLTFVKERSPWTRVIVWTGSDSTIIEREVWRRGVDYFIHKPAPLDEVARVAFGLLGTAAYA